MKSVNKYNGKRSVTITSLIPKDMSDIKDNPIQAVLDEKQESACELLDNLEEGLWEMCHDVRYLRIRLSQLDSLREKLSTSSR